MRPRVIKKEGPTGLITTTTAARLHPENETRLLSLTVTDTPEQTRAVMLAQADDAEDDGVDYERWHAHQRWLALGERRVVVPFAKRLALEIPTVAVRLRRDFLMLLSLVRANALLHRELRGRDERGRIVANMTDYCHGSRTDLRLILGRHRGHRVRGVAPDRRNRRKVGRG